jgi:hypothetical protein
VETRNVGRNLVVILAEKQPLEGPVKYYSRLRKTDFEIVR